ncbi:MAG: hypothetical protein V1846_05420 [Candidatus Komeilibacteria bacterium]
MHKLQEILDLARETGDRLIVVDQVGEPYVVMNLASYRQLLREESHVAKLTEGELLEKINRLVASWKANQPDLADYDLAQFRVDTIRQPKSVFPINTMATTYESVTEQPLTPRAARQEELLSQVIDTPDDEDVYYPEPTAEEMPI